LEQKLELGVNLFQAKIGPPRILLGVLAIGYAVVNIAVSMATRGEFVPWRHVDELLALAFGALNLKACLTAGSCMSDWLGSILSGLNPILVGWQTGSE
jgi:hypothetical protein